MPDCELRPICTFKRSLLPQQHHTSPDAPQAALNLGPRKGWPIAATHPGPCQMQLSALLRQLSSKTVGPAPLSFLGLPHARALSERAPTRCRNPPTAPFCSPFLFPQKETAPYLGPQRGPIFQPARPAAHFKPDKTCNQNTAALTKASRITRTALHARPETTRSLSAVFKYPDLHRGGPCHTRLSVGTRATVPPLLPLSMLHGNKRTGNFCTCLKHNIKTQGSGEGERAQD